MYKWKEVVCLSGGNTLLEKLCVKRLLISIPFVVKDISIKDIIAYDIFILGMTSKTFTIYLPESITKVWCASPTLLDITGFKHTGFTQLLYNAVYGEYKRETHTEGPFILKNFSLGVKNEKNVSS